MTEQVPDLPSPLTSSPAFPPLLAALRELILLARQRVLSTAHAAQVRTYWEIGRHIVEYEQGGEARAAYGKGLLAALADSLTREFGRGFDASNLRNMRLFYHAFPNCDALRPELSWTHYRLLLRVDPPTARQWHLDEAASQNWSSRVLERQVFASKYRLVLPSEEDLRQELDRERAVIDERLSNPEEDTQQNQ